MPKSANDTDADEGDFLFGVKYERFIPNGKQRPCTRTQTGAPIPRPRILETKSVAQIPAGKENKHRTPVKATRNQSDTAGKRTPLSNKRVPIASVCTPPSVRSQPIRSDYRHQSTPNGEIPGIENFPSNDPKSTIPACAKRQRLFADPISSDSSAKKPKVCDVDFDLGWKQSPRSSNAFVEKSQLKGFSNIGNTCYMNAILQALFGLDPFAKELYKTFQCLEHRIPHDWLFNCLPMLLCAKDGDNQELKTELLRCVKEAISSTATRFLGNEQHDAHEFMAQVLDQLKEEINKLNRISASNVPQPNPVQTNFEFCVCHCIECQSCHNILRKEEQYNDLSIDLPHERDDNPLSLQHLLHGYFKDESVSYRCEKCGSESAKISHKFTTLPRILTVHLKRYLFRSATSANVKIDKTIDFPRYLTLERLCVDALMQTLPITESTKKVTIAPPRFTTSNDHSYVNEKAPADKVKRQLFNGGDEEPVKSSNGQKIFSFRRDKIPYNTRSSAHISNSFASLDEVDETSAYEEVMERSKRETGPPDDYADNDPAYREQLEEAMRLSLMESSDYEKLSESCTADVEPANVKEPDDLDDAAFEMAINAEEGHLQPAFRLCGVVNHLGFGTGSGHYVADVFDITTSKWRSYDDSHVTEMPEEDVRRERQKTGYIFFYMAKDLVDDLKATGAAAQ